MRRAQTGHAATQVGRWKGAELCAALCRWQALPLIGTRKSVWWSEDVTAANPATARRGIGQPSLHGATCSMNSSRRSLVDLLRMASAEITTTAPPNASGRMREHVKDDSAETYLSVGERRTMSCKMDSQEVMLRSRSTSRTSGSAPCSFNRCSSTRVLATFSAG